MMKLFLSHASEDKDDFVRPLAEALRSEFEVWYDEYELTLGDSLSGKISEGLSACDYGIVVLSHHFFAKKWPRAELDGLFSVETAQRKVILPIWKNVSEEDVKTFSPILAGRLGVSTESGIEKVIQEIKRAVGLIERDRGLQKKDSWKQKFASIANDIDFKKRLHERSHSTLGVEQVTASVKSILSVAQARAFELNKRHPKFNIRVIADQFGRDILEIRALGIIVLRFKFRITYSNSIDGATFEVALFHDHGSFIDYETNLVSRTILSPDFDRELNVCWKIGTRIFSNEEAVLDLAYEILANDIDRHIKEGRG